MTDMPCVDFHMQASGAWHLLLPGCWLALGATPPCHQAAQAQHVGGCTKDQHACQAPAPPLPSHSRHGQVREEPPWTAPGSHSPRRHGAHTSRPSVPCLGPHHPWAAVLQPRVLGSLDVAVGRRDHSLHFTEEKIKAQRGDVLCPRPHSGETQSLRGTISKVKQAPGTGW